MRIFDVALEGDLVEAALDPFERGNNIEITVVKTITDGSISIALQAVKENPQITSFTIAEGSVVPSPIFNPIKINCGGGAVEGFSSDRFAVGGKTYSLPNCSSPNCSERFGNVKYAVPVPNGRYSLVLSFTEIYFKNSGSRIFNVLVEGQLVAQQLDILVEGNNVMITTDVEVSDGYVDINLVSVLENPKISSIQVLPMGSTAAPSASPPPPSFPIQINCGGHSVGGFSADQYASGGSTYQLSGCSSPECSERFGEVEYNIPVPNGDYTVTLSFTEIYFKAPGLRVFNVFLENQAMAENLDILTLGKSVVLMSDVTISDGSINISLTKVIQFPKISSITILPVGFPVPSPPTFAPTLYPPPPVARPDSAEVVVKTIKVFERPVGSTSWNLQKSYQFQNNGDLYNEWNLSNWGFDGFDGAYDPSAVVVEDGLLHLNLERN